MKSATSNMDKNTIITVSQEILNDYSEGITVRQLYYRLVARGLENSIKSYKRVVQIMTDARWNGDIYFTAFIDRERTPYGETKAKPVILIDEIENTKSAIESLLKHYRKHRWENQHYYIEVWIEKKALQGVFESPCRMNDVLLFACKGYPSITAIKDASLRFEEAIDRDQEPRILYFGDYDPSGQDIPRAIQDNLNRLGVEVVVQPIALNTKQISDMGLVGVPAKLTDSRTAGWTGQDVVELDAVEPKTLSQMCKDAIKKYFDNDQYALLINDEIMERKEYQSDLLDWITKKFSA